MSSDNPRRDRATLISSGERERDQDDDGIISRARSGVASLFAGKDTNPQPQGFSRSGTQLYSADADITRSEAEIEHYREEYEENPIISGQIENFAREVFEPGYWVEADSDDTEEEVEEFLENMGILGSKTHVSFSEFGKEMLIQHEVRGTFDGEMVTDDQGRHVALNPLNPSTLEIYTKPGTNVLLPPDYEHDANSSVSVKSTEEGDVAAFVQYDTQFARWRDRTERRFTREEMLHWPRHPDIGDQFGTSRLEAIYERSRALREKLQDNDLAIAMKAWPMVLFQMGTPERPWTEDQMEDFMRSYQEENLGPGMYQGVPGDVEIQEFAGETADITEHTQTDVDMIVSGLPGPKHALGSFVSSNDGADSVAGAQERIFRKEVRAKRRDIEKLMNPYLKEVAESWGYDPSGLELNIGRPDGEVAPEDVQGNIIRYTSDAKKGNAQPGETIDGNTVISTSDPDNAQDLRDDAEDDSSGTDNGPDGPSEPGRVDENARTVPDAVIESLGDLSTSVGAPAVGDSDTAELSDPRLVGTRDLEREFRDVVAEQIIEARDGALDVLEARYGGRREIDPSAARSEIQAQINSRFRDDEVEAMIERVVGETRDRTVETLRQHSHAPNITDRVREREASLVQLKREKIHEDLRRLASEMANGVRYALEDFDSGEDIELVRERIDAEFNDTEIERRVRVLGRVSIQQLVNTLKLTAYRDHEDVIGVHVINACTDESTAIGRDLAGCDGSDPAQAMFDSDTRLGEQFREESTVEPSASYTPLPNTPPFAHEDKSELAPVYRDNVDT